MGLNTVERERRLNTVIQLYNYNGLSVAIIHCLAVCLLQSSHHHHTIGRLSKPEKGFHVMEEIYAASRMCMCAKKTTFLGKDD